MAKKGEAEDVSGQLRAAIQSSGLSLNELSRQSGVAVSPLSRFVRGERSLTLPAVAKLCAALGLELCEKKARPRP